MINRYMLLALIFCSPLASAVNIIMGPNGCTLKDAIRSANADAPRGNCSAGSGADFIIAPDNWVVVVDQLLPTVTTVMTIKPTTEQGQLYISGDGGHRIFDVTGQSADLTLHRVTLYDAKSELFDGPGAAIKIFDGKVTLRHGGISNNFVNDVNGTAVALYDAELVIENSLIRGNLFDSTIIALPGHPSVIYASNSTVSVDNSHFQFNNGHSIYSDGGELTIHNSLFEEPTGVTAIPFLDGVNGWGVKATQAQVEVYNSTFANDYGINGGLNISDFSGADVRHLTFFRSTFYFFDSIIEASNNFFFKCEHANSNLIIDAGNLHNSGYNGYPPTSVRMGGNATDCPGDGTGGQMRRPLQDHGGPTKTLAIPINTDMVNGGSAAYCLPMDQRGEIRTLPCDVGAFELNDGADVGILAALSVNPPYASGQEVELEIKVINNGPGIATDLKVDLDLDHLFITSIDSVSCSAFPCIIPQLNAGDQRLIPIQVTMGNSSNNAFNLDASVVSTVTSIHNDPDGSNPMGNNFANINNTISNGADLGITLDLITPAPFATNQIINYRAVLKNHGNNNAQNVVFEFAPSGALVVQFDGCDQVNNNECGINLIANGVTKVVDIEVKVIGSPFNAVGFIESALLDVNPANNVDYLQNGGAITNTDVAVEITAIENPPFHSGQYIAYDLTVRTFGKAAVGLTLSYDFGTAEVFGTGACFGNPCAIADMAANSTQVIRLDTFAPVYQNNVITEILNTVVVSTTQVDTNLANNTAVYSQTLSPAADMGVSVTLITPGPYYNGQTVAYNVIVGNNGTNHATDVFVVELLNNLSLVWLGHNQCTELSCYFTQMDFLQNEYFEVFYRIDDVGPFSLAVSVSAKEVDEVPQNDMKSRGGVAVLLPNDLIFADDFE